MALHHAPDPLTRANAMGTLGLAHFESDNPTGAIAWLEQAFAQAGRFPNRKIEGRFVVFLAKAAALLDEALAAFHALGMPALVARADPLAREWAAPRGDHAGAQLAPVA